MLRFGLILAIVTLVASGALAWLNKVTYPRILEQQQAKLNNGLISVLPGSEAGLILPIEENNSILYYEGYSDKPMTFALSAKTDENGIAEIEILKKGNWVVNVLHEFPYPDTNECDKYRYNYCFTFKVK